VDALIETWRIHNRIHVYLLEGLVEGSLAAMPLPKGRSVAAQFAHVHNVRKMWLAQGAPDLDGALEKLEGDGLSVEVLREALVESGEAIEKMLERSFAAGKLKGFKPHPTAFVGYLISHESHHRGQIVLTLKQNQMLPSKKVLFGLWEWGVR
jgi:uncharacterized damage-inducible protein DinB